MTEPIPLRERKKIKLAGRIVSEAIALFEHKGYAPVMMDEIAAACDISKPTLYKYFASKQAITVRAFDLLNDQVIAAIESAVRPVTSPLEKAVGILDAWCDVIEPNRLLYKALIDAGAISLNRQGQQQTNENDILNFFRSIANDHIDVSPEPCTHTPDELSLLMATTLFATTAFWVQTEGDFPLRPLLKKHFQLILS